MIRALQSLVIDGIPTNIEFALRILGSDEFRDRELRISSMDSKPARFLTDSRHMISQSIQYQSFVRIRY